MDGHTLDKAIIVTPHNGLIARWRNTPLYGRIVIGVIFGVMAGLMLGTQAAILAVPGKLVLRLLGTLAPLLILAAIVHTFMTARLGWPLSARWEAEGRNLGLVPRDRRNRVGVAFKQVRRRQGPAVLFPHSPLTPFLPITL